MVQCKNCEDGGAMYDKRNGQRCAICGYTWEPTTGHLDERPTRPADAECGMVLNDTYPRHDKTYPRMVKTMCNDGTMCSLDGKAVKEVDEDEYVAACHHHN